MIKISTEKPSLYEKIKDIFGIDWEKGVVITYGDTIYCKYPLSEDLMIHEATHVKQQTDMDKDEWWGKYFLDKEFRLSQELEAYNNQMHFINKTYNRDYRRKLRNKILHDMTTMYGSMCTKKEAEVLLIR